MDSDIQERLERAMPWVGRYIAAASAICTAAMAADAFNGFRRKKLWFPCKYFSLDAKSLTLLAVAMKLPMDLTTVMICTFTDFFAKFSSLVFMTTAMGNFISSLGSMSDKEILSNVAALSILVITIAANVGIQLTGLPPVFGENFIVASSSAMLLLLVVIVASCDRRAADVTWAGVILYKKWLVVGLERTRRRCKGFEAVLEELSSEANQIVAEFKREVNGSAEENPINWPTRVVAANSMHRITQTILLSRAGGGNAPTDEGLFELLSVMIADILAACLTNLPHGIVTMCHHNRIEKRGKRVRKAFLLLGKTEQIVELLQQQEWPAMDHDKAAYIEEWRALFRRDRDDSAASTRASTVEIPTAPVPIDGEHLGVRIDS